MLTIDGITLRLGGHLVLDRASASLPPKARVGLVGRNGAGKSSLLKLIAGIHEPDDGSIETPSGLRIGYVAQDAPGGKGTPFDTCSLLRPSGRAYSTRSSMQPIRIASARSVTG